MLEEIPSTLLQEWEIVLDEMPELRDPQELYLARLTALLHNVNKSSESEPVETNDYLLCHVEHEEEIVFQPSNELEKNMNLFSTLNNRKH